MNQTDPLDEIFDAATISDLELPQWWVDKAKTAINAEIAKAVDEAVKKEQERCKAILKLKLGL